MKQLLLAAAACFALAGSAHAQSSAADTKALAQRLNQLMRDPKKPHQEVRLDMNGCHATQVIRDTKADVKSSAPISVSYNKGGDAGWAANVADGKFELSLDFEWREVETLTYARGKDADDAPYQIKIKRVRKSGTSSSSMNFDLPLFTSDERVVRDVVARLEKVRQSCR